MKAIGLIFRMDDSQAMPGGGETIQAGDNNHERRWLLVRWVKVKSCLDEG